jgi:hypothetical protein
LNENGKLFSWGFNGMSQLGHGDTTDRLSPTKISFDFGAEIATIVWDPPSCSPNWETSLFGAIPDMVN